MQLVTLVIAAAWLLGVPDARAAGKLYYGSRAGMTVTVVSMSGLDTGNAVIVTRHTRADAVAFCREYAGRVTEDCIRNELGTRLNDEVTADCRTGHFVDFFGNRYRYRGFERGNNTNPAIITNLQTNERLDGSSASGYPTAYQIYRALCPRTSA